MKTLSINGQLNRSEIILDPGVRFRLGQYFNLKGAVVVTDENIVRYYRDILPNCPRFIVGQGEGIKHLKTVEAIYDFFLEHEVDRHSFVIAIGGGIVCDITGFAAATFMRGIPFGFLSTTLLSQVDASVGGKNGVNFNAYKNMIGTFTQPETVLIDPEMLTTLPLSEVKCGLGEMLKHGMIKDKEALSLFDQHRDDILALKPELIEEMIYRSLIVKSEVVVADERERGERKKLNFGHTMGHAIEKSSRDYSHGEAVAIGMVFAIELSVRRGHLDVVSGVELKALLKKYQLPESVNIEPEMLFKALGRDKKRHGQGIDFILLKAPGEAIIEQISLIELREVIDALC